MRGRLIGVWLVFSVIITGCISTSSEPEIVRVEIVPDSTPTADINSTSEPEETIADTTDATQSLEGPQSTASLNETPETPAPTAVTTGAVPDQITIEGIVRNATTNTAVEEGIEVTAALYENPETNPVELYNQTVTSGSDGAFRFEGVPTYIEFGLMVVSANYQSLSFPFAFLVPDELDGPTKAVELFVYDVTTDTSDLLFSSYNIFFDASPNEDAGAIVVAVDLTNQGNQLIFDGQYSFRIPLPANAINPQIQIPPMMAGVLTDASFVIEETEEGFVIQGTIPFLPGRIFFQYSYEFVYEDEITLTQLFNYDVEQIAIWVPPQRDFTVNSEQLASEPDQSREGEDYVGYSVTTPIESGDTLTFTILGGLVLEADPQPANITSGTPIEENSDDDVGILVVGLGITLILSGVLYMIYDLQKSRQKMQKTASDGLATGAKAKLIEQIALLDTSYERGEIEEMDYQQQRNDLKEQLRRFYK